MSRARKYFPTTCPVCGKVFVPHYESHFYCSTACANRRANAGRHERRTGLPAERLEAVSFEVLRHAKTRPRNCSPVRWDMERSRRELEKAGALDYAIPAEWCR